jgi:hypothetical protein
MSPLGNATFKRSAERPDEADLLGPVAPARKSASHGEAGYVRNARDAYFTEPWVTRALLAEVSFRLQLPGTAVTQPDTVVEVWEPAVGDGRMAAELERAGYRVFASDIHDYGWPDTQIIDFVHDRRRPQRMPAVVTNPPFDLAREFVRQALIVTEPWRGKVAILQRHEFDAPAINRPLFAWPYAAKLILPRRPKWSDDDKASPRFPYAWYLWDWRHEGPPITFWLDDPA